MHVLKFILFGRNHMTTHKSYMFQPHLATCGYMNTPTIYSFYMLEIRPMCKNKKSRVQCICRFLQLTDLSHRKDVIIFGAAYVCADLVLVRVISVTYTHVCLQYLLHVTDAWSMADAVISVVSAQPWT